MLLYAPGGTGRRNEPVPGNAWLHMEAFLLGTGAHGARLRFRSGRSGASSPELAAALGAGVRSGEIEQPASGRGPMRLTESGIRAALSYWDGAGRQLRRDAALVKELLNDMAHSEMTAYMYSSFPGSAGGPGDLAAYEDYRQDAAYSLFRRDKLSLRKSASVAGMGHDEFVEELARRGIPAYSMDQGDLDRSAAALERICKIERMGAS